MKPKSYTLGFAFMAPSLFMLTALFFAPVIITAIFAFTNMSTATGISGSSYTITPSLIRALEADGLDEIAADLTEASYVVDAAGLASAREASVSPDFVDEIEAKLFGQSFENSRAFETALRNLHSRPTVVRQLRLTTEHFTRSVLNTRYPDRATAINMVSLVAPTADSQTVADVVDRSYTGWRFTPDNFLTLLAKPGTWRIVGNTVLYVAGTLAFNVFVGLFLAISTFYLPKVPASLFSALWLLPRITPVVLYAIMWKWFTWDTGFVASVAEAIGLPSFNYMKGSVPTAWTIIILLNGFIGASFGLILFSGALRAIPVQQLWASEVDGANRWQQITRIILPQMRWPILFVTSYQTLSLLSSYETIWLTTEGGPGNTTSVWALEAFRTALSNYTGNLQYGLGSAMALILVGVGLLLSILYLFIFKFDDLVNKPKIEF